MLEKYLSEEILRTGRELKGYEALLGLIESGMQGGKYVSRVLAQGFKRLRQPGESEGVSHELRQSWLGSS